MNLKKKCKLINSSGLSTIALILTLLLGVGKISMAQLSVQPPENGESNVKVLFAFDDHSIPWKKNLKLTMVTPDKHPNNPVVARGPKGSVDEWAVQFYGSVIRDKGKFRMWYISADDQGLKLIKQGKGFSGLRPAYAESEDGINWHKPDLGLVEHNGNKANNLVKIDPQDAAAGVHLIVIHEPKDPNPGKRYKMLLTVMAHLGTGEGRGKGSTTIVLFSADGLSWKAETPMQFENGFLLEKDLMLPAINFEQGGLYRWNGIYYLPGQVFSPTVWQPDGKIVGRVMTILRSRDLIKWDSLLSYSFIRNGMSGKVVPVGEGEESHIASSTWNRGNVLLGVHGLWHGAPKWQDRSMDLGLMLSNDGISYREPTADYVLISKGKEGEWDQGGLIQGQGFANVGDKTFIWYGSWDMTKPSYPPRGGVGLVTLRRDGFGYLATRNQEETASFETRIIEKKEITSGKVRLLLNAENISKDAPIKVELLDKTGLPIPGYAGKNAALVVNEGLYQEIKWAGNRYAKVNKDFSVKISYPNGGEARVYALYFENIP
ncbi:hypothetical protein [Chitinophaga sp. MM2321]|uniref:hypothetical protein n=1 Tax=Chitinophaga sp. MM2321 TaxID=3137178 RepID=UPI0032D56A4E